MAVFQKIEAWRLCHTLYLRVHEVTATFPRDERFELTSQLRRAGFSAAANIVEGAARRGPREFRRFLDISLGSLAEVTYGLQAARDLGYLTNDTWKEMHALADRAGKCTWGLYRSVSKK